MTTIAADTMSSNAKADTRSHMLRVYAWCATQRSQEHLRLKPLVAGMQRVQRKAFTSSSDTSAYEVRFNASGASIYLLHDGVSSTQQEVQAE